MPHQPFSVRFAIAAALLSASTSLPAQDWRQWRGPSGDNHAASGTTAPVAWNDTEGLAWETPLPGRGYASPTLVGNRIYLTTANDADQTQSLLIIEKATGQLLKQQVVHRGNFARKIYKGSTHSNSTVASDGQRLFTLFLNDDATWLTCFDLAGERLWQNRVGGFTPQRFEFGHGSSPVIADGLVVVANEYDGEDSCIVAYDVKSGAEIWRMARPANISFSSPAVARLKTGTRLLISGADRVTMYDLQTGSELWSTTATTKLTCGTIVWNEALAMAYASGGYPTSQTVAVRMEGDHEVVWENKSKCYEQSMLVVDEFVYAVADGGVAFCWRGSDGETMWKQRLGGKYSSSPLLVDNRIYVTNQAGITFVFKATPTQFELLSENQLGTSCFATPTPSEGRLYHRFARGAGSDRQEYLAAIGE